MKTFKQFSSQKSIEIQAPNTEYRIPDGYKTVFLAGSIEMGKATDWQKKLITELSDLPIVFFNPRRNDWDSSWKQTKEDPQFSGQVKWELKHLEKCDIIAMYIDPETKSPITLLELGIHANVDPMKMKLLVCCPEGFY